MALISAAVAAGPITGTWTGKLKYDFSKLPNTLTTQQKQVMIDNAKKRVQSKLKLKLNPDHTFVLTATGVGADSQPVKGRWTETASSVNLQKTVAGKPDVLLEFPYNPGHKSFSYTNGPITMTFSR